MICESVLPLERPRCRAREMAGCRVKNKASCCHTRHGALALIVCGSIYSYTEAILKYNLVEFIDIQVDCVKISFFAKIINLPVISPGYVTILYLPYLVLQPKRENACSLNAAVCSCTSEICTHVPGVQLLPARHARWVPGGAH